MQWAQRQRGRDFCVEPSAFNLWPHPGGAVLATKKTEVLFRPPTYEGINEKQSAAYRVLSAKRVQTSSRPDVVSQRGTT